MAITDGLASYESLPDVGIGHQAHLIGEDSRRTVVVLPRIHKLFSLFKRLVLGTFQGSVSHQHLPPTSTSSNSVSTAAPPRAAGSSSTAFSPPPPQSGALCLLNLHTP